MSTGMTRDLSAKLQGKLAEVLDRELHLFAHVLPAQIGRLHLGDKRSDGERLCSHCHQVPAAHPLYWPERIGEHPDDIDPLCLEHAIEQAVDDNAWCEKCCSDESTPRTTAAPTPEPSDTGLRAALAWYGEQARLSRLIHSEGDAGRHALAADGGKRANEALAQADVLKDGGHD